jgi:hypothetical protein
VIVDGKEPASFLKLAGMGIGCVFFLGLTGGIWFLPRWTDDPADPKAPPEMFDAEIVPSN